MGGRSVGGGRFATTRWSLVLAARDRETPHSREALSGLCRLYWYPIYAFARRSGLAAEDAQDAAQGFFAKLLEQDGLRQVDPSKGRFRSFLLTSFRNFLSDARSRSRAGKRGGGQPDLSIDLLDAEGRYVHEPADESTPERIFDRRWAITLLARAIERLREEHAGRGPERERLFERLKGHLAGAEDAASYADVAAELGLSPVTVRVAVHRMRRRYRELLLDEISETLGRDEDLASELRHLMSAIDG
jgi:RNA polymerase sigma-70 factor (ECF subfamily)